MPDFSLYAGRWVALTESNEVASVGLTLDEARRAGRVARPKEHLRCARTTVHPPHIPLPEWPLAHLHNLPDEGIWLAGGPVRDLLLGRTLHDWDFAVVDKGRALARQVANDLNAAYYTLDNERDTGRVVVTDPGTGRTTTLDFAALRGATIEEDLRRRDFTINAMALTLDGVLIDPTGGQADLQASIVRMTNPFSFRDDPARLLRAVRQANSLNFRLEPRTELALRAQALSIKNVAPERVRAELINMLSAPLAANSLQALADFGLLSHVLPEIQALQSVQQSWPHHYADTKVHTLATIAAVEGILSLLKGETRARNVDSYVPVPGWAWSMLAETLALRQAALLAYLSEPVGAETNRLDLLKWGALFHDVGKAATHTLDDAGHTHFYGHAEAGIQTTEIRLTALRFPNKTIAFVVTLVNEHLRLITLGQDAATRRAIYRFFRDTGDTGIAVILLALADALAVWGRGLTRDRWRVLLEHARTLCTAYFDQPAEAVAPPPLLNGHDLVALSIPQGPEIGRLLEALREAQATGELTTRDAAEAFILEQTGATA